MKSFMYIIKTPTGMHARHAGLLAKEASRFQSEIMLTKGDRSANAKGIFALMGLGIKQGDLVQINIEGEDEDVAVMELKNYIWTQF